MTSRQRLEQLRDLAISINSTERKHLDLGKVMFYWNGEDYCVFDFNNVEISLTSQTIDIELPSKDWDDVDNFLFDNWVNGVEEELENQVKKEMISIDGKKFSKNTIKEALKQYTE